MSQNFPPDLSSQFNDPLITFSDAKSLEQKTLAIKGLMKGGAIHAAHKDLRFSKGLNETINRLNSTKDAKEILLSLAILSRVANRIKPYKEGLKPQINAILRNAPPPLSILDEAEDRAYVAQSLRYWATGDWIVSYVALCIVNEETGEKVRSELIRTLFCESQDLTIAFKEIQRQLVSWEPKTESPGDSVARRLKRIFSSMRREILSIEKPSGSEIGTAINSIIVDSFRKTDPPRDRKVAIDFVAETAFLIHDVIRTNFSIASISSTYLPLTTLSRWFAPISWPQATRSALQKLSQDIQEAILMKARQGLPDDELLKFLTLIEGSRTVALRLTSQIADRTPSLNKEMTQWLRRGRVTKNVDSTEIVAENSFLASDTALAFLLLDSFRLVELLEADSQDILTEMRIFNPELEEMVKKILELSGALTKGVEALAKRRSLFCRGEIGNIVDYSSLEQEPVSGSVVGATKVRVIRPLVERIRSDQVPEIVVKAIVNRA